MRILILGAGGTGGYFGSKLLQAGCDVHFLVRAARAQQLQRDGLSVRSPLGDRHMEAPCLTQETLPAEIAKQPFDLVLLSCKAYDLNSAIEAIAPAVGPQTAVLPILNGLAHYDVLDARFGHAAVLGGLCHISVTKADDGSIVHLGKLERLTFGAREDGQRECVAALLALCQHAGIDVVATDAISAAQWDKYSFLTALAAGTCLMQASVGEIVAVEGGAAFLRGLYAECLAVATAEGHAVADNAQAAALEMLTRPGSTLKASMLRDLLAGHRTEAAHIVGDMLQRAQANDLVTPLLQTANCYLALRGSDANK